jgi:hypothetical protein
MIRGHLARWAIAFMVVLFYAGGTYALTASGSPASPATESACVTPNLDQAPTAETTTSTTIQVQPTTTTSTTTSTTELQPTTTTSTITTTSTTTELQPTTTTSTTTDTTTSFRPTTTTSTVTQPTTMTSTVTQPTTTTETTTTPVTTTATTTSPTTTTETTTLPVTETQHDVRTVTATATCTATHTLTRPGRPTIVRFHLLHGTVLAGSPVVALLYAYPAGAKAIVTITRGRRKVATAHFVIRHEPTKLTIPATKVSTPGHYVINIVIASGPGRSRAAQLHLRVLAPSTAK